MKVYIISADKMVGIAVANLLNRRQNMNAIVSESDIEGYDDEVREAGRSAGGGDFDYVILISSNPYKAGIDINKVEDARAVVCKNRSDISAANSTAEANVIIFDGGRGKNQLLELVGEFADLAYGTESGAVAVKPVNRKVDYDRDYDEDKRGLVSGIRGVVKSISDAVPRPENKPNYAPRDDQKRKKQKAKVEQEHDEDEDDEEEDENAGNKKGLLGKIKYTFGLE